jgi:hypothetical protein
MNPAKCILATAIVLVAMPALAGTITFTFGPSTVLLNYSTTAIGGGLTRYDVFLDDPNNSALSYFLGALTFSGVINQDAGNAANTQRVDSSDLAAATDGNGFYSLAADSFFFQPFTDNLVGPGITDNGAAESLQQRMFAITAGSGGGSQLDVVQIAQIVAQGNVAVSGTVSRNGQTLSVSGDNVMVPEPSTFALIAMAMLSLATFVRWRSRTP